MNPVNLCNGLTELVETLRSSSMLSRERIEEVLRSVEISFADVEPFVRFSNDTYTRNLVYGDEKFQALVLCWMPSQGSPVHGHGISACGMKVISGAATEASYHAVTDSSPYCARILTPADVIANGGEYVHKVTNLAAEPLITLHVYSPPLVVVAK